MARTITITRAHTDKKIQLIKAIRDLGQRSVSSAPDRPIGSKMPLRAAKNLADGLYLTWPEHAMFATDADASEVAEHLSGLVDYSLSMDPTWTLEDRVNWLDELPGLLTINELKTILKAEINL